MNQLVKAAYLIARLAHKDQVDKAGMDYIRHPIRVAEMVKHLGEEYQIVAILHDVVEDTSVSLPEIRAAFGDVIADAVLGVTRLDPKYAYRLFPIAIPERETYRNFVARSKTNPISWAVKIADVRDNASLERMASLTADEQEFLIKRYGNAKTWLMTEGAPLEWS